MSGLLSPRQTYKPFLYEKAFEYWQKQQNAHWLATEVSMAGDIQDWKSNLTESERAVVAGVLKGFIQTELVVNDYWTKKVSSWFRHPEIAMMCSGFGSQETIHVHGYAYLNDSLGIEDYDAFLSEPTAKAKIDRIVDIVDDLKSARGTKGKHDIALSLAVFSAFTEGVSIFSAFAVLLNFSRFNKLKGVGQIISWSIKDESLHSQAGCWLFREFIKENPEIWTDEMKKEVYEAARTTVDLEDAFIDQIFRLGEIEGLTAHDLKAFIRHRANTKLQELGLKQNWKHMDREAVKRMEWFDFLSMGVEHQDFFAQRPVDYAKGLDWSEESLWPAQKVGQ